MIRSLFFMFIMMMAGTSSAEGVSPCDIDPVPIQIIRGAVYDNVTTLSAAKIYDFPPGFISFVKEVTGHLVTKLAQEEICLDSNESKKRSLLQFVSWPITSRSQPLPSVPLIGEHSSGVCRISSPWVDIIIERKPVPLVRGIFRYNERQLLSDQAVLAGARDVAPGLALPIMPDEFIRFADLEYKRSEIQNQPLKKPIEDRVPPDLLWLFRRTGHDSNYPFSDLAGGSMRKAMEVGAEGYTKIVIRLIDHCLDSDDGLETQYDSILDIDDPRLLEQYKIISSIVQMPIP